MSERFPKNCEPAAPEISMELPCDLRYVDMMNDSDTEDHIEGFIFKRQFLCVRREHFRACQSALRQPLTGRENRVLRDIDRRCLTRNPANLDSSLSGKATKFQ